MIYAKKEYGQNFLKNDNIIEKIVNTIDSNEDDLIIEIGPGKGALTSKLVKKSGRLICFEVDERMKEILSTYETESSHIEYNDFLQIDIDSFINNQRYDKLYIISNLPYYITTPIISKIISMKNKPEQLTFMVQDEVADRLSAKPKTKSYGLMTVLLQKFYNVEKLFVVKPSEFIPAPKVDSAVIKCNLKETYDNIEFNKFKSFLEIAFSHKRKTLKNNLTNELWQVVSKYLIDNNINLNIRAEELSVDDYINICNLL